MTDEDAISSGDIYQPYAPNCTTHSCTDKIVRYVKWPNNGIVAGFCDECAEIELRVDGKSEVTERVA